MTRTWLLGPAAPPRRPSPAGAEGAYFRETFPYSLPPLTRFEADAVPLDPAPEIWITDTTFRDGQQSRSPYTPEHIADLYARPALPGDHGLDPRLDGRLPAGQGRRPPGDGHAGLHLRLPRVPQDGVRPG